MYLSWLGPLAMGTQETTRALLGKLDSQFIGRIPKLKYVRWAYEEAVTGSLEVQWSAHLGRFGLSVESWGSGVEHLLSTLPTTTPVTVYPDHCHQVHSDIVVSAFLSTMRSRHWHDIVMSSIGVLSSPTK